MEDKIAPSNPLVVEVRQLLQTARRTVAQQVNTQLLETYWEIGRVIVKYEQKDQTCAEYGQQTPKELSRELTREFGKGFSRMSIRRLFYLSCQKCQTVSGKLIWRAWGASAEGIAQPKAACSAPCAYPLAATGQAPS